MSCSGVVAKAHSRRDREDDQPDGEDALAAVLVAEHAPGEQQRGEHEDVGVDGPQQLARIGVQVALDGGQRDVEDRAVEDDDEQAGDQHGQDRPAARVTGADVCQPHGRRVVPARGGVGHVRAFRAEVRVA